MLLVRHLELATPGSSSDNSREVVSGSHECEETQPHHRFQLCCLPLGPVHSLQEMRSPSLVLDIRLTDKVLLQRARS